MPLTKLREIPVNPQWSEQKRYVIQNMPHTSHCRIIFQSRTRFWKKDGISPSMHIGKPGLEQVWSMADEAPTEHGLLIGDVTGVAAASTAKALDAYRSTYPGKSEDIEKSYSVNWPVDPWASTCLPGPLPPGVLSKYWPEVIQPFGRIHFAGVYADDYPFGMEGAVRSAQRAVREIENA
jgi:monoamine oxidase